MNEVSYTKKAFVDILLMLEGDAKSFSELKALGFSPNTILLRLRNAQKQGLIKEELFSQGGKKSRIKYTLTNEGRDVLENLLPIKSKYLDMKKEIDDLETEIRTKEQNIKYLLTSILKSKHT